MTEGAKVVLGWVDEPVVKPHGGRAQTRASNIKDAAAERLEALVNGTAVGRGVENTDSLKVGDLLPVPRLEAAIIRIGALRARINNALQGSAETDAKAWVKADLVVGLRKHLVDAKAEALSIWRDMPTGVFDADLAVRLMAAIGGMPAELVSAVKVPVMKAINPQTEERCSKCHRLLSPPKGVFGCQCGKAT